MANAKKRRYEQQAETLPGLRMEVKAPKTDPRVSKPVDWNGEVKTAAWQDQATIHRLIDFFKGY